jgi:DNA mismatch repair protein MutS
MLHVDDLRIQAEILPLFNYTHSFEAETRVTQLLQELPPSLGQILEKQQTLQALAEQWAVLADFTYPKIQLQEVRSFLHDVVHRQTILETNRVKMGLLLLVSEQARYRSRARYVQTILFLQRLEQHYFSQVQPQAFPESFKRHLTVIRQFLERFSLAESSKAISEDAFSAGHMVRFARQLSAVSPEVLQAFWESFYLFEAYWSIARGMRQHGLVFPVFQEAGLDLVDFYHPLLAAPVRNTLQLLPGENVVVLTGPNMAGKSTLLKAVGLCVYLAHAGVGVPAAGCRLPFFSSIVVTINLADSLLSGYSHFMAEIQQLKAVLQQAQGAGRVFAVFDELFRGTNVDDALDITRATLQGLAGFPASCFFVSTHLLQLESQLPVQAGLRTYCIECVLQDGIPVFSYRLQPGWSGLKIGRIIFDKEGLHDLLRPTLSA